MASTAVSILKGGGSDDPSGMKLMGVRQTTNNGQPWTKSHYIRDGFFSSGFPFLSVVAGGPVLSVLVDMRSFLYVWSEYIR